MSRMKSLVLMLVVISMLVITASSVVAQDEELLVTYVVNGTLGDKSFFDSGQRGLDQVMDEFNVEVNTIELGIDPANWETGLNDAMANVDEYDVLVVGTWQMSDFLAARAHLYPDKVFILFDVSVPYDNPDACVDGCSNVYSITYKQNDGSFLAGVYAAAMTVSDVEGFNSDSVIGTIGAQDIPVINDFIVGYEQGACLVDPNINIIVQLRAVGMTRRVVRKSPLPCTSRMRTSSSKSPAAPVWACSKLRKNRAATRLASTLTRQSSSRIPTPSRRSAF